MTVHQRELAREEATHISDVEQLKMLASVTAPKDPLHEIMLLKVSAMGHTFNEVSARDWSRIHVGDKLVEVNPRRGHNYIGGGTSDFAQGHYGDEVTFTSPKSEVPDAMQ